MKITTVSYRRLISGPGFTHQAIELTAEVLDGDTADSVLARLKVKVNDMLGNIASDEAKQRQTLRDAVMKIEKVMDESFPSDLRDLPF